MSPFLKKSLIFVSIFAALYGLLSIGLFLIQEKLLFFPSKILRDKKLYFDQPFEERWFTVAPNTDLHAVHFRREKSKGVILFLHGNGGAVDSWATGASIWLDNGWDVLFLDYREYGKSGGKLKSDQQMIEDAQVVYEDLKQEYGENRLGLSGTSMGTGVAAALAAQNKPAFLILNAPYFSLQKLIREKVPIVLPFLIKYKFPTFEYAQTISCPVHVFHGEADQTIPVEHGKNLKAKNPTWDLHTFPQTGHNDLSANPDYQKALKKILQSTNPLP